MLPQSIPDLPNKLQQRADWEAWKAKQGKADAKKLVSFANYTPLAVVVPFVNWLLSVIPDAWLRSADGRGEEEFHHYTPKIQSFDAGQWEIIDGETWYFTRRGDRFCDIAYNFLGGVPNQTVLYQAQSPEWQAALPWRVTLWEDTELPGNFPIRIPPELVEHVKTTHALTFDPKGHGKQAVKGKPGLNIDAPKAPGQGEGQGAANLPKGGFKAAQGPSKGGPSLTPEGKTGSAAAIVIALGLGVAILASRGKAG